LSFELEDTLDLHALSAWKLEYADRRPGVHSRLSPQAGENVGSAVDDAELVVESRRRFDETQELDDPGHPIEASDLVRDGPQHRQCASARGVTCIVHRDIGANGPCK